MHRRQTKQTRPLGDVFGVCGPRYLPGMSMSLERVSEASPWDHLPSAHVYALPPRHPLPSARLTALGA